MEKIATVFLITMVVCSMAVAQERQAPDPKVLERQANARIEQGDWEGAADTYNKILKSAPLDSDYYLRALTGQARAYSEMGEPDKAMKAYSRSRDLITTATEQRVMTRNRDKAHETKYEISLNLAKIYSDKGDITKAREEYSKASEALKQAIADKDVVPGKVAEFKFKQNELNEKLGEFLVEEGDLDDAIETYESAVQEVGTLIETQVYDKLPATFDKEITAGTLQSKRDVRYPLKLAKLYEEKGDYEKARQMYKEVRRAADRALTADTYQNNLPKFQEELNTILEDVRAKLEEMDMVHRGNRPSGVCGVRFGAGPSADQLPGTCGG